MEIPIISSKFTPPSLKEQYVARAKLENTIQNCKKYKLMIVYGQAGSGKTTLLRHSLPFDVDRDVWIRMDESFNDYETFWRYLLIGFNMPMSSIGFSEGTWDQDAARIINHVNALDERIFVLDDFHVIKEKSIISTFNYLLDHLEEHIHFVISSRHSVELENPKRLMTGSLKIVQDTELRFDKDESYDYLKNVLNLNDKVINSISEISEGWIGAMHLLALNPQEEMINHVDTQYLNLYIQDQVLSQFENDDRVLIHLLAMIPFFNDKIIDILSNSSQYGKKFIQRLIDKKMMIQESEGKVSEYRFHHLLQDSLNSETNQNNYLGEVAEYYLKNGYISEALTLFEMIKDVEKIIETVVQYPDIPEYYYYLKNISVEAAIVSFDFVYQKFFYHYSSLDMVVCQEIYKEAMFRIDVDPRFEAFRGINVLIRPESVDEDLRPISQEHEHDMTQILLAIRNAVALSYQSKYHESLSTLDAISETLYEVENFYVEFYALNIRAQCYEELGYFKSALNIYDKMDKLLREEDLFVYLRVTYYISKAGVHIKKGDISEAKECLEKAQTITKSPIDTVEQAITFNHIELLYLKKEDKKAYELLKQFMPYHDTKTLLMYAGLLKYPLARRQVDPLLKEYYLESYKTYTGYKSIAIEMIYAQVLVDEQEKIEKLNQVLVKAKKEKIPFKIIEITLSKIRLIGLQDERTVLNLYKEALHYASDEEIMTPFIIERESVIAINSRFFKTLKEDLDLRELRFHESIMQSLGVMTLPALSERELEVLICIQQDLSNKEIAAHLHISLSTVKTHIINIYKKLDVNSRVGAVEKGKELQIL